MHERTQRAIARLMFVFCCAVPTSLTLLCILVTWTPWYHRRALALIETELSRDTGLVVVIEDFQRGSPGTIDLHGLRLLEPETRREVARVREVQWVNGADQVSILLQQPELQSAGLPSTWQLIHDRFLCRPEQTDRPVQLAANGLTIHSHSGAVTLRDVDAWIQPRDGAVEASIQCLPAISLTETPINITVRRDRSGEVPITAWTLDTNGSSLPCSALADYLPDPIGNLGSEAVFAGTMTWQIDGNRWWIDLSGSRFEQVSLDRVFEKQAHRLSGTATLEFERCKVFPHERIDIACSLRARNGLVGRSLLHAVQRDLGFEVHLPDGDEALPYDRIALRLTLNNTQLRLDGICRTENGFQGLPVGVVMFDGYPRVLSAGETLPAVQLMSVLAPSHSVQVPLSSQNSGLMGLLIPPQRPLPRSDDVFPPRIRTAQRYEGGPLTGQPQ